MKGVGLGWGQKSQNIVDVFYERLLIQNYKEIIYDLAYKYAGKEMDLLGRP